MLQNDSWAESPTYVLYDGGQVSWICSTLDIVVRCALLLITNFSRTKFYCLQSVLNKLVDSSCLLYNIVKDRI